MAKVNSICFITGIDYEGKEFLISLGNDNMIYVETLLAREKGQVTPLFPEPLVTIVFVLFFYFLCQFL